MEKSYFLVIFSKERLSPLAGPFEPKEIEAIRKHATEACGGFGAGPFTFIQFKSPSESEAIAKDLDSMGINYMLSEEAKINMPMETFDNNRHGKTPSFVKKDLPEQLKDAIATDDFETAALLRDKINGTIKVLENPIQVKKKVTRKKK